MKKCKANYIKILEALKENSFSMVKIFDENGNKELAEEQRAEARAFQIAAWLLSDYDNSFKEYGEIFFPDEF